MRYLGLALFAEGPSDHHFFPSILRRTTEDLCLRGTDELVEVSDVIRIVPPRMEGHDNRDGRTKVVEAVRQVWDGIDLLFLHSDGGGDFQAAMAQRILPARALFQQEPGGEERRLIGVVPIREMEAWALVDGDALRLAFGTTLTDAQLGIPATPAGVEGLPDPKLVLQQAYEAVVKGRKPKREAVRFLPLLGERIRLERLRLVPAFGRFESELQQALLDLSILKNKIS